MNSISTKGKWIMPVEMVAFYTVAFFGAVSLLAIFLS